MELYAFLFILIILGLFIDSRKKKNIYFYICCAILLFLACFRAASVGIDHADYIDVSLGKAFRYEEKVTLELVWGWFNQILSRLRIKTLFTITTSLFMLVPLFLLIKKESTNKFLSLLLFLLIPTGFCFFLTGIRQSIATAILIWVYYYIINKKYLYATILMVLSVGIHASSFFVLLFLPLAFVTVKKNVLNILLVLSAVVGFLFKMSIFDMFSIISPYVDFLSFYEGYSSYHTDEIMNLNGLISVIVPPSVFAFITINYGSYKDLYVKLFSCGVIGTNFFANVPMIGRYFMYFTILQIILIPSVLPKCPSWAKMGVCITIIYMILYFFLFIPYATGTDHYVFSFNNI